MEGVYDRSLLAYLATEQGLFVPVFHIVWARKENAMMM